MEKRNFFLSFFFFLVLSFLTFVFASYGVFRPLNKVVEPIRSAFHISSGSQNSDVLSKLGKASDDQKLQDELNALRDQFDSGNPAPNALLPARVIGAPTFIPGITSPSVLIIDKGEEDGVKTGMAAVIESNLVGEVFEVGQDFSKVDLITNDSFSTTAKVGNALGVLKGDGSSEMVLGNVALSENLNKGDIVYSKGSVNEEGIGIVPDLVIGRIVSVDKKASDIFQKAKVESYINFESITHVFLVLR